MNGYLIFIFDIIKSIILGILIGGPLLAFVLWFFETGGPLAWLYCWLVAVAFTVVLQFLAPVVIMPLFNKFTPIDDGELIAGWQPCKKPAKWFARSTS